MSATLKLYEAGEALDILDELIAEHAVAIASAGGDIEAVPEIAQLLAFAETEFDNCVERWALKIIALKAEIEAVKMERVRLQGMETRRGNALESLKSYLKRQLEARGREKFKTPLVSVRIQRNGQPSVSALSESLIETLYASGSELVDRRIEYVLDREKVLAEVELGHDLPDGITVATGNHLRVS